MGRSLYQASPAAREAFQRAEEVLGFPLLRLCFEGPEEELRDTANAQPAIFVASYAAWKALEAVHGPLRPGWVAGHSLGEYTALAVAGCFAFEDGARLVRLRGLAMQKAGAEPAGGMAAVLKLEDEAVEALCQEAAAETGGVVQVANYNCPGQVVISGDRPALERAMQLARERGGRVVPLRVSVATHSRYMEPAVEEMREALAALDLQAPQVPVVGNVEAMPLRTADEVRQELLAQLTSPVRWTQSIQYLQEQGVRAFVEVGPGNVLAGLVRRIASGASVHNVGEWEHVLAWPGG
ncbi:MAG: ACP S-malonyltransferase [Anaerolineae bacterium]|nr:ACP S-malonyltransferase [Anaerolineae bacterium]